MTTIPRDARFWPSLAKYGEVARTALANRCAYFGDALARPLFFALILFVFMQLWQKVFAGGRSAVEGFGAVETLWYMVMTEAIMLSVPRLDGRVDVEVKSGSIAYLLGRPCNYVGYHLAYGLGESLPLFGLNLCVGSVVALLLIGSFPFRWSLAPVLLLTVFAAFVLHFYISMSIALLAFWVEDAGPFFWIYSKMLFILGGLLIPLSFFPLWLRRIAEALPFRTVLCGPARLFVHGRIDEFAGLFAWQCLWIAVFAALAHGMFLVGRKRVHVHGG